MEKFDKTKYDMDYRKVHKSQFNVDLNKDEKDELDALLKESGMSKAEFLRKAIKQLRGGKNMKTVDEIMDYIARNKVFAESQKQAFEKQKEDVKFDSQNLKVYNSTDIAIKRWEKVLEEMNNLEKFINCEFDKDDDE